MAPHATIQADPNPVTAPSWWARPVAVTVSWTCEEDRIVEVRVDAPDGPLLSRCGGSGAAATGKWVQDGTSFYLQDVTGGKPLGPMNTLATATVRLNAVDIPSTVSYVEDLSRQILEQTFEPPVSISSLSAVGFGDESICYRVQTAAGTHAIKLRRNSWISYEKEYLNLLKVGPLGLGPKAFGWGTVHDIPYLVTGFVQGREFGWDPLKEAQISGAARFFSRLHAIPEGSAHQDWRACCAWAKELAGSPGFQAAAHALGTQTERYLEYVQKAQEHCRLRAELLSGPFPLSFCHGNPNLANLMMSAHGVIAVDWAYAQPEYYAAEIADFFVQCRLTTKDRRRFFDEYAAPEDNPEPAVAAYLIPKALDLATFQMDRLVQIEAGTLPPRVYVDRAEEIRVTERELDLLAAVLADAAGADAGCQS